MAKKKRRQGRRPRPETRAAQEKSQASVVTEEKAAEDSEDSEDSEERGSAPSGNDEDGAGTSREQESSESDSADAPSAPEGDEPEEVGATAETGEDSPSSEEAPSDGESAAGSHELASEQESESAAPSDGELPESEASDGELSESEASDDDASSAQHDSESSESLGEEEAAALDSLLDAAASDGPSLVGEGIEIDESEVEDTEQFLKGLVEAILFSSDKPQTAREIARAAKLDKKRVQELIELLIEDTKDRGVRLCEVSEGYGFRTNPSYSSYVREFLAQRPVRLSRAQLETLAIMAYRQPLTRPEVDDIRGVDSGAVIKLLLERDLIRILGKKDEPGRPMIYGTTPQFLDLFSLSSLRDLPTLREFTELSDDSRAKFELEIGEPAPEGPIEEEEVVSEEAVDESTGDDGEPHTGEDGEEDLGTDESDAVDLAQDSESDDVDELEATAEDASSESEDDEVGEHEAPGANDDDGDGAESESESSDGDVAESVELSAADEEEFPDDEDDEDDDDDDDDD